MFHASDNDVAMTLPLVFHNTGPNPVVLVNLRLRPIGSGLPSPLVFQATRAGLSLPDSQDQRRFATAIVLSGREARLILCEFMAKGPVQLSAGDLWLRLEGLVEGEWWPRRRWRNLGKFPLRMTTDVLATRGPYITHDNDPS